MHDLVRLLGAQGGSALGPPLTSFAVSSLVVLGLAAAAVATKGRALLWIAAGLLPALPTASLAGPHLITARYQVAVLPVAAAVLGIGAIWLSRQIAVIAPAAIRQRAGSAMAVTLVLVLGTEGMLTGAPETTVRLEYAFFRQHLGAVPRGCWIVRPRWSRDLGLEPPLHLSTLRRLEHEWLDAPPASHAVGCLVYWRAGSCSATAPGAEPPDCGTIESRYQLIPIAEAHLPARPAFVERYREETVRVGFYYLRPRAGPHR
jgi:hypothetical protein